MVLMAQQRNINHSNDFCSIHDWMVSKFKIDNFTGEGWLGAKSERVSVITNTIEVKSL